VGKNQTERHAQIAQLMARGMSAQDAMHQIGLSDERGGGRSFWRGFQERVKGRIGNGPWEYDLDSGRKRNIFTSGPEAGVWVPMDQSDYSWVDQQGADTWKHLPLNTQGLTFDTIKNWITGSGYGHNKYARGEIDEYGFVLDANGNRTNTNIYDHVMYNGASPQTPNQAGYGTVTPAQDEAAVTPPTDTGGGTQTGDPNHPITVPPRPAGNYQVPPVPTPAPTQTPTPPAPPPVDEDITKGGQAGQQKNVALPDTGAGAMPADLNAPHPIPGVAGATTSGDGTMITMDHVPLDHEIELLGPGKTVTTQLGTLTIGADGSQRFVLNEVGQQAYNAEIARIHGRYGRFPFHDDPDAPRPEVVPGGLNYDPYTNQWID
jgi:hypothetical protein